MNGRRGFLTLIAIVAMILSGCQADDPPSSDRIETPATAAADSIPTPRALIEVYESPTGEAALVFVDSIDTPVSAEDYVLLVVDGDTTEVFRWNYNRNIGIEWLSDSVAQIWLPVGGNSHHYSQFVHQPSGRTSPPIENDVAIDIDAGRVLTFEVDAFRLRNLWTAEELASWSPDDLDLYELRQRCDPVGELSGEEALIRFDCGEGVRERRIEW